MFVQAMVERFYQRMYYVPHFDNIEERLQCTHDAEIHSFDTDCALWPYKFHTHMHSLGDKYDCPGLIAHSCKRLRRLLKLAQRVYDLDIYIQIWDLFYHRSRNGDALRELLIESISTRLRGGSGRKLQRYGPFYSFVERSPEIAGELFKEALIYASFGAERQEDERSLNDVSSSEYQSSPRGTQVTFILMSQMTQSAGVKILQLPWLMRISCDDFPREVYEYSRTASSHITGGVGAGKRRKDSHTGDASEDDMGFQEQACEAQIIA